MTDQPPPRRHRPPGPPGNRPPGPPGQPPPPGPPDRQLEGRHARKQPGQHPRNPYDYERIFTEVDEPDPTILQRAQSPLVIKYVAAIGTVVVLLIFGTWITHQFSPAGHSGSEVTVEIPQGSSIASVGGLLKRKGVVPNSLAFHVWAKIDGDSGQFQAGEYTFHSNESPGAALRVLHNGPKAQTDRITIPEGLRLAQIAERVGHLAGFSEEKFLAVANSGTIRSTYEPDGTKTLEGFLFPDTYTISPSDNETTLVERMVNQFDTEARLAGIDQAPQQVGHTPFETLIIASMIESEAKTDVDRGKISQVIENRLFKAMPLQIDATVLYAIGNTKQTLSNNDLKFPSPYNTYVFKGLPPGPISNPGRASIQAALRPTPGDWLYYVLGDKQGNSVFATTLDEQKKNVADAKAKGLL